jgi:hypothetical protein
MRSTFLCACCATAALSLGMAASAQTTGQQPPQNRTQTNSPAPRQTGQTVVVRGCIESEADFRKARNLGRGGSAGTGVGVGNEFVLIDPKIASAGGPPRAGGATGTTGAPAQPYKLTGANEGKVSQFVGKRVEITGTLKPMAQAAGAATGPTADGRPPQIDVFAGDDLKLSELEVASVRETAGTCPAK